MEVIIAAIGVFLGCLCRTSLPYLRKARENPSIVFDRTYVITFLVNVVLSMIASILIFPTLEIPSGINLYQIFTMSFVAGWGSQDIINQIVSTRPSGGD